MTSTHGFRPNIKNGFTFKAWQQFNLAFNHSLKSEKEYIFEPF